MEINENGDDMISPNDKSMIDLEWHVFMKYDCPIKIIIREPIAPLHIDQYFIALVPKDHEQVNEVIEFLKEELQDKEQSPQMIDHDYHYGTHVQICKYAGFDPYVEKSQLKKLALKAKAYLMKKVLSMKE